MEDFLKFLAIAGVIAFGIFKQFAKEKEKNAENERPVPAPSYETYEMELPPVVGTTRQQAPKPKYQKRLLPNEGVRTTYTSQIPSTPAISPPIEVPEEASESEFSIHSAEEARRAIIWSEILQRKY